MLWLWLVIAAYILNAFATLISKWLLLKEVPHPVVFTFYIGVLNLLALVLVPFGFYYPGFSEVMIALGSGAAFGLGLYLMNVALQKDQASQVAPLIGGLQPIFILVFAWWFLPESLVGRQYLGIVLLIVGSLALALEIGRRRLFTETLPWLVASSAFFGLSFASLKLVYLQQSFVAGFVWSRLGVFLFLVLLVLFTKKWALVKQDLTQSKSGIKSWFIISQIFGAISFVLVAYAISLGPVTIINALQGLQYAVLFVLVWLLAKNYPKLLDEPLTKPIIVQKIFATTMIILGLALVI